MPRHGGDEWRGNEWRDSYGDRRGSSGRRNESTGSSAGEYGGSRWGGEGATRQSRGARGPKGWTRSDERIKDDISEQLYNDARIDSSEVTIEVEDGKVTLQGTVDQRYMKHAIEDLVDGCPGVKDIDNRIRVSSGGGSTTTGSEGSSRSSTDKH
jgi:osmotically-inducible protein OsmY